MDLKKNKIKNKKSDASFRVRDSLNELFGPLKAFCLVCDCTLNPVKQIDSSRRDLLAFSFCVLKV